MNIAQLSEQLKDVPQNTLIGYAKNPNSVVPQFLALAEIQRRQQLQAPAQAPASTVANDLLSQAQPVPQMVQPDMAQQLPENQPGVTQLPANLAPQGFAPGGLVAFRAGGVPEEDDEDYSDYVDRVETAKRRSRLDEAMSMLNSRVAGIVGALPQSYEEAKKSITSAASDSYGDLKSLLSKVSMLESGGKDYDKYGRLLTSPKGAEGRMQTLRSTQRDPGFGVTPARDSSVEEKNRVGEEYFAAMLEKFKDPKIAAMAYNWGPGNVQRWLDSGRKTPVPQETLKYASHFAKGGIADIPRFYEGQKISVDEYNASQEADDKPTFPSANIAPIVPVKEKSRYDKFFEEIAAERAALKEQAQQDAYLALMQAGLGMMGGSSPYALQNIGQGGAQGIAAYGAFAKQRGAESAALRKAEAAALEGMGIEEVRRFGIEEKAKAAQAETEQRAYGREERTRAAAIKEANDVREAALARFNQEPSTKALAKIITEEARPGSPEYEWYRQELERQKNNALAIAKVPGYSIIPNPAPFPKNAEKPGLWDSIKGLFSGSSNTGLSSKQQELLDKYK